MNFPKINAFPVLAELSEEFKNAKIYLAGGAVRDTLLNKKITDIDIVVQGISGDMLEEFLATRGRVVFAGKNFGVWKFHEIGKPKNEVYDIALPRKEFSLHRLGAYRDFAVKTDPNLTIEEDLGRRDFTINAMAWSFLEEKLIDTNNGQKDVENSIIKTVGKPEDRFQEDYSRMLRAIRFSLQLSFKIEENTGSTIKKMISNINNEVKGKRILPYEVIAEEFLKSFKANPSKAFELWREYGATEEVAPELLEMRGCEQPENWHQEGDVWSHTKIALETLDSEEFKKEFNEPADIELIIATLFHDIGKPYTIKTPKKDKSDRIRFDRHDNIGGQITKSILERIRASSPPEISVNPERIEWLVRNHMVAVHGDPQTMRPVTIEKYFFSQNWPSKNLIKLLFADSIATKDKNGKSTTDRYEKIKDRISKIKKATGSHGQRLVKPLITGKDVISEINIKPGPKIGEILENIRQKQLSGEIKSKTEAINFIKQN